MNAINMIPTDAYYKNLPQLSLNERDRRWSTIRAWMETQGIDCLLSVGNDMTFGLGMGNFRYLANSAPRHGGFLIFPLKGEPCMFAEPYHMTRPIHPCVLAHDWVKDCYYNKGVNAVIDEMLNRVPNMKKVGFVCGANTVQYQNMPFDIYDTLITRLKGIEIVDASKFIFDMRGVKSDEEVAFLTKAGQIHHEVLMAEIDAVREGATEADVFAAMGHAMIKNGAEPQGFNLMTSGPLYSPKLQYLLHGLDADMCPTMRKLERGDTVIGECHISYGGYMTASEFTLCVGQPPKEYERLFYVMVEAFNALTEKLVPGNQFGDVIDAARAVVRKHDVDILELGMHSHGLGSPEPPWGIYMHTDEALAPAEKRVTQAQKDVVIQKNMVFGTNGDLFDSKWRPDLGIMFGDCVLVTDNGPKLLVNTPQKLIIK